MSKQDFMNYLKFIRELFPKANIPVNPEIIAMWYKAFENTHLEIGKSMAQMYFQDEQNSFNYARLLQYKRKAMANKAYIDEPKNKECKLCGGTGLVQIEKKVGNHSINIYCQKCVCENALKFPEYIKQVEFSELEQMNRDSTGIFRIIEPKTIDTTNELDDAVKAGKENKIGDRY